MSEELFGNNLRLMHVSLHEILAFDAECQKGFTRNKFLQKRKRSVWQIRDDFHDGEKMSTMSTTTTTTSFMAN